MSGFLDIRLLHSTRPADVDSDNALLMRMSAPDEPRARVPVTAAVVMDSSGSMEGPRLDALMPGLERLASGLRESDKLVGVGFGGRASVLWTARPAGDRHTRTAALRRLRADGSARPADGLRLALNLLRVPMREPEIRRLVLITDWCSSLGGERDADALGDVLVGLLNAEVAITAVGVGSDFDETTLVSMAEATGGTYVPVEDPRDLPDALQAVAYHFQNVAFASGRVEVTPVGRSMVDDGGAGGTGPLPDVPWGRERRLLMPLRHEPRRAGQYVVASVSVSWVDATSGQRRTHRHDAVVEFGSHASHEADGLVRLALAGRSAAGVVRGAMGAVTGAGPSTTPLNARLAAASDALRIAGLERLSERVDSVLERLADGRMRDPNKTLAAVVIEASAGAATALF